MTQKTIASLFAGILLGSGATWILVHTIPQQQKSPTPPPAREWKIEPLFLKKMESCRVYRNFYETLLSSGKLWHTDHMASLASTCTFFSEVELYLLANKHLQQLPEDRKADFVLHYQSWHNAYLREIRQPFAEEDGTIQLTGTMTIPMDPGRRDDLIQAFLDSFPERVPLRAEHCYQKKDFEYIGQ